MNIAFTSNLDTLPNDKQHAALVRLAERYPNRPLDIQPMIAGNGAFMVGVGGVWYGIEIDGYCHS
jgi:hypothetical protein